jgi:hypothetical protein
MDPERIASVLCELRMLPFFVATPEVLAGLVRLVGQMCENEAQVRWLVSRMTSGIYQKWPGPAEMRACFCGRYRPKDGINAYSTVFPDGLPPERTTQARAIQAPEMRMLESGAPKDFLCGDPAIREEIREVADLKRMPKRRPVTGDRGERFQRVLQETLTAPQDREPTPEPTPQIITKADIDRAVQEYRAKKLESGGTTQNA